MLLVFVFGIANDTLYICTEFDELGKKLGRAILYAFVCVCIFDFTVVMQATRTVTRLRVLGVGELIVATRESSRGVQSRTSVPTQTILLYREVDSMVNSAGTVFVSPITDPDKFCYTGAVAFWPGRCGTQIKPIRLGIH